MNFSTAFQLDSITLPAWAATAIRHTRQAAVQSQIILKAFSKTIAPQILTTAKDLGRYYVLCGQGSVQWMMNVAGITHNPVQAAVRAAYAELVSNESIATYRRICTITRETAMDGLIIGLCGVIAVSVGVEVAQKGYALAQKVYRAAQKLYTSVYARLNPSEPQPELLPSCEMALASTELAAALDHFATVAEANVQAKADADAEVQYSLEAIQQDFVVPIWNPAPRDIHEEIARMTALQPVASVHSQAPEPVAQPAPEPQSEQKPARAPRNRAKAQPQDKANAKPKAGATAKGQRKSAEVKAGAK